MGFNKRVVDDFFQLLGGLMDQYKFKPDRIYNCDETGISSVPKSKSKIIASKGRKQVGAITSAERGETVTVEICMNAAGTYMPPFFIFPRKRFNSEFMRNAPIGSIAEFHQSGWMQKDIFEKWMVHFIQFSHATQDNPVLLLLDGHCTHTKSIELIQIARDNGVVLLCFPPHCTHRLQPLDVAFMKPLSTYYDKETTNWLRNHGGDVVTLKQLAEIFGLAFIKAATMTTAINGFQKTGICPFNPDIFNDLDFMAAETTNVLIENDDMAQVSSVPPLPVIRESCTLPEASNSTTDNEKVPDPMPGCSHWNDQTPKVKKTTFKNVSPEDVLPVPQQTLENREKKKRNSRFRGKTAVITESPYKKALEEHQKNSKKFPAKRKVTNVKKKLFSKPDKPSNKVNEQNDDQTSNEDDVECLYCGNTYLQSNEGWVQCRACLKWAHCSCAGEDDNDDELYHICDICKV
ncbi:unnamed protein product [Macrosiphum euphorbiae]|uniref:DDE-1 domain-containing protein n=2 Tax=Macrosiphum euphorbiae TaxID=13131 RepID=A0AAV0WLE0_9HEMI|nr:unnamed protein product [Macrosiphum euphorbiae]